MEAARIGHCGMGHLSQHPWMGMDCWQLDLHPVHYRGCLSTIARATSLRWTPATEHGTPCHTAEFTVGTSTIIKMLVSQHGMEQARGLPHRLDQAQVVQQHRRCDPDIMEGRTPCASHK